MFPDPYDCRRDCMPMTVESDEWWNTAVVPLPDSARELLQLVPVARRAGVAADMRAVLNGGLTVAGSAPITTTLPHFDRACSAVFARAARGIVADPWAALIEQLRARSGAA